ncbi:tetratricopeptide repeat protein [Caldithrix abyssi]
MKKLFLLAIPILVLTLLTSCRPPELEGAFVDYNAGRYDNALKLAKEATEKYPTNAEAWYLLGEIYGKKEMYSEMKHAFDKALANNPTPDIQNKIKNATMYYFQNLFNRGVTNYNTYAKMQDTASEEAKEQLRKSTEYFKKANIVKPDYKAVDLIAFAYSILGEKDSAFVYYTKLTQEWPDSADAYVKLGRFYVVNQKFEEAIPLLEKALELDPENADAIQIIAEAYDFAGKTDKAIETYKKAMEINPEEKAFPFNLGRLYFQKVASGSIDDSTKQQYLHECAKAFGRVIELDPSMKEAYDYKSNCELMAKDYEDALVTLKQATERFPDEGKFWYNLGVVYYNLKDTEKAQEAIDKAKELGVE